MTDEQKKEICKAFFYGYSIEQIAEIEDASPQEAFEAVRWGEETGYSKDLEGRGE